MAIDTRSRRAWNQSQEAARQVSESGRPRDRRVIQRVHYAFVEMLDRRTIPEELRFSRNELQEIAEAVKLDVTVQSIEQANSLLRLYLLDGTISGVPDEIEDPIADDGEGWRGHVSKFVSWRSAAVVLLALATIVSAVVLWAWYLNPEEDRQAVSLASPTDIPGQALSPPFPLSGSFDSWEPSEPVLEHIWNEVELSFQFTNTSEHPWEFFAAATLRRPDGRQDHLAPMRAVQLEPGNQGVARWTYIVEQIGEYDVIYGVWAFAEEGKEPEFRVDNNGWQSGHLVVHEGCPTTPDARIFGFSPFKEAHVLAGGSVTLSMDFRNTGVGSRKFVAGASIVDTDENLVGNYDTVLEDALLPGQTATVQWEHMVQEPGNYLVQFGVWERPWEGLIYRAPCPMERLIIAHPPGTPLVNDVALESPTSGLEDQWITIAGENFKPYSAVILKFMAVEYPVDAERVEYQSSREIRVRESLTVPGTWQVRVVNSGEERSNWLDFRVLP